MSHIFDQAYRYGEQVRLLEDQDMEEDRARVRAAWVTFRNQLDEFQRGKAFDAYYNAYCQ